MYKEQIKKKKHNYYNPTTTVNKTKWHFTFPPEHFGKARGDLGGVAGGMTSNCLKLLRWKNSSKKKWK